MKKLSIIIIAIGIIIFSIPLIGKLVTSYLENKMISAWQNGKDLSNDKVYMSIYNADNKIIDLFSVEKQPEQVFTAGLEEQSAATSQAEESTKSTTLKSTAKPALASKRIKQEVLGIIKIPKISVSLPIVEGVKKQNLRVGIGHFPGTAELGEEGNSAFAGHRSYAFGKMFNRLNELGIGDKITIITKKCSFVYKVYDKFVVLPKDVYVLNQVKKDNVITLITCTPVRIATHRLIIRARLEK